MIMGFRIAIDVREAFRPKRAGKGQWTAGFLRELRSRPDVEVIPVVDDTTVHVPGTRHIPGSGFRWHRNVARWLKAEQPADAYVSPTSYLVPAILRGSFPCVTVVHDLIAFRNEKHQRRAQFIER